MRTVPSVVHSESTVVPWEVVTRSRNSATIPHEDGCGGSAGSAHAARVARGSTNFSGVLHITRANSFFTRAPSSEHFKKEIHSFHTEEQTLCELCRGIQIGWVCGGSGCVFLHACSNTHLIRCAASVFTIWSVMRNSAGFSESKHI